MEKQWSSSPIELLFDYQDTEECCSDTYWDLWNALPPNRPIHLKAFINADMSRNAMNRLERREAKKKKMCDGGDDKGTRRNYTR